MKKTALIYGLLALTMGTQAQTLVECQRAAEQNYPMIQRYGLIEKTTELTVANTQKGWLPQLSVMAQATYQSDVTSWPDEMKTMMAGMGVEMKGLKKDQYRVGIDVSQTIYDGGAISSSKTIAREQGLMQVAQTQVDIYNVRRRVNEMYFSLLMLDEQIRMNKDLQTLLEGNERKLESMVKSGTAAGSDWQSVKAERLNAMQQMTSLESQRRMLYAVLSRFCGMEVRAVQKPNATMGSGTVNRPEMQLFDSQLRLADAQEKALDAAVKPRLGVFVQGFYGYPGYNMFEDMMKHEWSLNGMIGARLTWNIGALYTRKNDKAKIQFQRNMIENSRDVFLFNNSMEQLLQNENIARYRKLISADDEIISLRSAVRKAAESKLSHGIIDVNDLVREINSENAARIQKSVHEIEMLKEVFDNKYTTNN